MIYKYYARRSIIVYSKNKYIILVMILCEYIMNCNRRKTSIVQYNNLFCDRNTNVPVI